MTEEGDPHCIRWYLLGFNFRFTRLSRSRTISRRSRCFSGDVLIMQTSSMYTRQTSKLSPPKTMSMSL